MSEDITESVQPPRRRRRQLVFTLLGLLIGLVVVVPLGTARNQYGRNLHGTVYCAQGPVVGVFIEAERLSRIGSLEVQSGFAHWQPASQPNSATFDYWLPYGGMYSIHFGCMSLDGVAGGWGTDNRTPVTNDDEPQWWCDNPANTRQPTVIVTVCRSN